MSLTRFGIICLCLCSFCQSRTHACFVLPSLDLALTAYKYHPACSAIREIGFLDQWESQTSSTFNGNGGAPALLPDQWGS